MTNLFELLFETGIAVGRAAMTSLLVMALHFFSTGADTPGFVVQSGLLKVHGCGHEMGNGLGTAVFFPGHALMPTAFKGTGFTMPGQLAAGPVALRASFARSVHAGTAFGASFAWRSPSRPGAGRPSARPSGLSPGARSSGRGSGRGFSS